MALVHYLFDAGPRLARSEGVRYLPWMFGAAGRVLFQSFLPSQGRSRAYVWKYSHAIGGRRPRHFHVEPELNLIVAGSATFGIGDVVVRASAGDLLAFPPGQDHALLEASPELYLYAIGMDPPFSSEVLGTERHSAAAPLHARLPVSDFQALAARASDVVERTGVEQRSAELWEHAHWLGRRSQGRASTAMHVLTRRTLHAFSEQPELGLTSLARKLNATPSEISRYFHRDVGMTLVRYRTRLRLIRFIRLADAGTYNLMVSASEAGFGSYSQCHRIFQAELGCAPRHFFMPSVREAMQQAYLPLSA